MASSTDIPDFGTPQDVWVGSSPRCGCESSTSPEGLNRTTIHRGFSLILLECQAQQGAFEKGFVP